MHQFCYLLIMGFLLMAACGDLSEQRSNLEKIKEGRQNQEIKRVTEDQILAAAYILGEALVSQMQQQHSNPASFWIDGEGKAKIDSSNRVNPGQSIRFIPLNKTPGLTLSDLEKQFLEAYQYSFEQQESMSQNVQTLDADHMLYTAPHLYENRLDGFWSVVLTKKDIILNIESV